MRKTFTFTFFIAFSSLLAQVSYTANDKVTPYTGKFRPGINLGYYPNWDNSSLGDLAAGNLSIGQKGIGARGNRTGLYEIVLDFYGYNLLHPDIQHWNALGMGEFVAILGGPTGAHQDYAQHCPGKFSSLFANLYTPVWDGGANGTPYNDQNYWAAYVYKVASTYKGRVRFWEIWNEPGFDETFSLGWRDENYPGNWWKEGPNPCDNILRAPIYHYIRTLRVAWEVIKTVDPDAYVCLGSVGFQSFLNAILSNTDNPVNGDVSVEYPLTGGAYFDCISFHSYPHFDGSTTNYGENFFQRHSDQAADGLLRYQQYYQVILDKYGYNGAQFPKKEWIVTEINTPRKAYSGQFIAGKDAQINHMMKAMMVGKIHKFNQLHSFQLVDQKTEEEASYEFHLMGLYKKFDNNVPYDAVVNDEGKALKTWTDLLYDTEYDPVRSAALNLPPGVRGYAWKRPDGRYVYSIWARTTVDMSEAASAVYSFPAGFNLLTVVKYAWDYGYTGVNQTVSSQNIALDARPLFFTEGEAGKVCTLIATVQNLRCEHNGTPADPADDVFTFEVKMNGANSSGSWTLSAADKTFSGAVGAVIKAGPFPIAGGTLNLKISDPANPACTAVVEVAPPPACATTTSAGEADVSKTFTLYPNPARNEVSMDLQYFENQSIMLSIYNALGQLVQHDDLGPRAPAFYTLNTGRLTRGAYWVSLQTPGNAPVIRKLLLH